jgi:pectinesterase
MKIFTPTRPAAIALGGLLAAAALVQVQAAQKKLPAGADRPDIIVAQDGSGDFTNLQTAIDSVSTNNTERKVIFIRNGTYREHVLIEDSFLTLLGEDRKKTRIVWEINDERIRPDQHKDGKGVASLNLHNASDIVIENLTIENPANLGRKPYTVSSTGTGTRIVIQNADILGLGGDTLSLWSQGLYYHRHLRVTGTYHFVGPRGTCYLADSVIEALGTNNDVLFNEGKDDEREKFVLHHCTFLCQAPFFLGSWFRDGAWYFVDCRFPDTLLTNGIPHLKPKPDSQFKWPTNRIYFAGCKGPDYPWLKDNIEQSPARTAAAITAAWTFSGQWDPELMAPPAVTAVLARDGGITVTFSESVTVRGKPAVILVDGASAGYKTGSGTTNLIFALPAGSTAAAKSFDLSHGTILASQAGARLRYVTGTSLPPGK